MLIFAAMTEWFQHMKYCIILLALFCGLNGYAQEDDDIARSINLTELVLPVPSTKAMSDTAPANAPANAPVKLSKTQSAIIKVLLKDNRTTYEDLDRTIGVDRTTIRRNIAVLKEKGAIRRVGEDKNGYWQVLISIENVV